MEDTTLPDKVAEILQRYDGKKITKRMATAVEKELSDHEVRYNNWHGMYHLRVWENGQPYDSGLNMLLGYHGFGSDNPFDHEKFCNEYAACYLRAAKERNSQREHLLRDDAWLYEVAKAINELEGARAKMKRLLGNAKSEYCMLNSLAQLDR